MRQDLHFTVMQSARSGNVLSGEQRETFHGVGTIMKLSVEKATAFVFHLERAGLGRDRGLAGDASLLRVSNPRRQLLPLALVPYHFTALNPKETVPFSHCPAIKAGKCSEVVKK